MFTQKSVQASQMRQKLKSLLGIEPDSIYRVERVSDTKIEIYYRYGELHLIKTICATPFETERKVLPLMKINPNAVFNL